MSTILNCKGEHANNYEVSLSFILVLTCTTSLKTQLYKPQKANDTSWKRSKSIVLLKNCGYNCIMTKGSKKREKEQREKYTYT